MYAQSPYSPADPRPEVQGFIRRFHDRFGRDPDAFNAYAFDAMNIAAAVVAEAIRATGEPTRRAVRDAFAAIKDVPTVIFGPATFDPETRRVNNPRYTRLQVRDGRFTVWDGQARPA